MAIQWTEDLATDVELIDQQHKEIFNRINRLLEAGKQGKGKQEVADTVDFLEDYVRSHFTAEESIQKEHAYPEFGSHKAEHTKFLKDVDRMKQELMAEGATLSLSFEVNRVVVEWLVSHIKRSDRRLAEFLRANRR